MFTKILLVFLFLFSNTICARETVLEVIPLHNRPSSELHPLITPLLEDSDRLIENGNSLIIKTTAERLPIIQALIKKLDTALTNLSITVIQSKTKTARELNASASITVDLPVNQPKKTSGYLRGRIGNTQELNDTENRQVLRTMEGKPAYIKAGKMHPLQNISIYDTGYGYPSVSTDTQLIEASTGFAVVPRLSGQQVILEVSPWSDNMKQSGIIETQSAQTSIRTNLGEWVEIGSINEVEYNKQQGFLKHRRSTIQNATRIIIKVDRID